MQEKGQIALEVMAAVFVLGLFFIVALVTAQQRADYTDAFQIIGEESVACRKAAGIVSLLYTQGDNVQWTGTLDYNVAIDSNSQLSLPASTSSMFCRYFGLADQGSYGTNVLIQNQNGRVVISNV